ncbi:rhodanese-like domain-containing protein [Nocardioides marinus]|nr:rhodanese-like domain-containing protein [Nocardioides marinus]
MNTRGDDGTGWSRRRVLVLGLATVVAGAGYALWQRPNSPEQPKLGAAQAFSATQAGALTLVDVRTPKEWRATGVPLDSHQIDMRRADFAPQLLAALGGDKHAPVALICARGVRSARQARLLADMGFSNVVDVAEGMLGSAEGPGWIARKLPVARWPAE